MSTDWKRGQRVRYIAKHCASLTGKTGTVTGVDRSGWVRVRFDVQQSYEKGTKCAASSLEPEQSERLEFVTHVEGLRKALGEIAYYSTMTINAVEREGLATRNDDTGAAARKALERALALREIAADFNEEA